LIQFFNQFKNCVRYNPETARELDRELLEKSLSAAPGFFMGAAWVTFKQLGSLQNKQVMVVLGLCLVVLSMIRFLVGFLHHNNKLEFNKAVLYTKINIVLNGLLWSVTLIIPSVEFQFLNMVSNVSIVTFIVGFSLSSMVTLSYVLTLAYFFQWCVILPSMFYLYYLGMFHSNDPAFHAAVIMSLVFLYMLNQTRTMHNQAVKRIQHGLELTNMNNLLQHSRAQLLEEKAKLQHSIRLAAVGEISGEIAHEINNPLGLIVGYLELSLEELKSEKPSKEILERKLLKARSAISRITKIIRGLRHYSKNTVDEPMLPIFINEIIDDAVDFCSEKFNYHRVKLKITNPYDFTIQCRPIEISQVLLNVFTNAIDEVSRLDIEDRLIELQTEKLGEKWVRILISNAGPSIDPSIQDRLFEPFFSTKKMGIGTGLGLSISRNIVENHGGRLYYDPSYPLTTFIVELPLA
jgi:signal transduction histidine kinase